MPAPREYTRTLRGVIRRFTAMERETMLQAVVFLREFQARLQARLTTATTVEAARIQEMINAAEQMAATYEAQMIGLTNGALKQAANLGALSVTEPLQAAGVAFGFFQPSPAQINTLLDFSADLIKGITSDMLKNINREIRFAALSERSTIDAMKNISDILGVPAARRKVAGGVAYEAERILRTETSRVFNVSTHSQIETTAQQVPGMMHQWLATDDTRTRFAHFAAHGQLVPWDQPFRVGGEDLMYPQDPAGRADNTINCLLPENEVLAPGLLSASRSFFSGPALELTVASGDKLTVTPNHPILTPAGWTAAQFIEKGDDVIRCLAGQEIARTIDPDNDHMPAPIEQIWRSLFVMRESGKLVSRVMAQDFHGDGRFMNGNIDIVTTDSQLWGDVSYSTFLEHFDELNFRGGLVLQSFLSGFGSLMQFIIAALHSPDGIMGGGGQLAAFFRRKVLHPDSIGFANSARFYPRFQEMLPKSGPADTNFPGKFLLRFSQFITTEPIIKVRNIDFNGHVYDLQTVSQLYISNGYVVHNCRCREVAVHPEIGPLVTPLDEGIERERERRAR